MINFRKCCISLTLDGNKELFTDFKQFMQLHLTNAFCWCVGLTCLNYLQNRRVNCILKMYLVINSMRFGFTMYSRRPNNTFRYVSFNKISSKNKTKEDKPDKYIIIFVGFFFSIFYLDYNGNFGNAASVFWFLFCICKISFVIAIFIFIFNMHAIFILCQSIAVPKHMKQHMGQITELHVRSVHIFTAVYTSFTFTSWCPIS